MAPYGLVCLFFVFIKVYISIQWFLLRPQAILNSLFSLVDEPLLILNFCFVELIVSCSFYEYLLKVWMQGNKTAAVKRYRSEAFCSSYFSSFGKLAYGYSFLMEFYVFSTLKLSGRHVCREMWEKSMKGLLSLVKRTTPSSFTYICEKSGNTLTHKVRYSSYTCISQHNILFDFLRHHFLFPFFIW